MSLEVYCTIIEWLKENAYMGRIGYLLHYEPTMDPDMKWRVEYARKMLPGVTMEVATNGIIKDPALNLFDVVDCVPARSRKIATSRAGNCRATPEMAGRTRLEQPPCMVPVYTLPIAVNGDVLLCCQDWRHEAVVGTCEDLTAARENQLSLIERVHSRDIELCRDCMAGNTAEEVGYRLGKRNL